MPDLMPHDMSKTYSPKCEQELCDYLCQRNGEGSPVRICGGGTKMALANNSSALALLDKVSTSKISGIKIYEPASLTLVAGAGTLLSQIEETLASEGQHLAFEPADYRGLLGSTGEPTIGGIVSCGLSGPRRIQAGACRDALIGVRFVSGEGTIIKNGGRVMKNVTGYDLVKLMCGSYGTLGALSEVSFKLLPRPQACATLVVHGLGDAAAVSAMCAAMASPHDVSGAAHLPPLANQEAKTCLRVEGFEKSVASRIEKLKSKLSEFCPNQTNIETLNDTKKNKDLWQDIRDVERFIAAEGSVWRISVAPTKAPTLVNTLHNEFEIDCYYDWSGGLIWLNSAAMSREEAHSLRQHVSQCSGHATLVRRAELPLDIATFHPENKLVERMSRALRNKFDPVGILNPALMD